MMMFDVAEWVANILILGIGLFFWVASFALCLHIIYKLYNVVKEI